jgi:hypothetical protein
VVAVALVTAAKCEHAHRHAETVEVVWTGPEPADTRFRQTEQAVLEVIDSAAGRLTVVSYAVYRIPRIRDALVAAAGRGVRIRLIVETPNRIEGQGEYDCRLTTRDGEPAVEWTWDGNDEMDPAQGRGWAVLKGDELHGTIFFHGGDDSEFVATKAATGAKGK